LLHPELSQAASFPGLKTLLIAEIQSDKIFADQRHSEGILTLALLLFVMVIHFFEFTELERVLGDGKLDQIFFRRNHLLQLSKGKS
jgi:hypothetical protein